MEAVPEDCDLDSCCSVPSRGIRNYSLHNSEHLWKPTSSISKGYCNTFPSGVDDQNLICTSHINGVHLGMSKHFEIERVCTFSELFFIFLTLLLCLYLHQGYSTHYFIIFTHFLFYFLTFGLRN